MATLDLVTMTRALITIGFVLVAIVAYVFGNRFIGKEREGGCRAVSFVAGMAFCILGAIGLKELILDSPVNQVQCLAFGLGFVIIGLCLVVASAVASSRIIRQLVDALSGGL